MPKTPLGLPPRKARWFSLTDEEFALVEPILKEIYRIRPRAGGTRSPEERANKDWERNIRREQTERRLAQEAQRKAQRAARRKELAAIRKNMGGTSTAPTTSQKEPAA